MMNKLFVMIGLPGSGKTWLAKEYGERYDAVYCSSDAIRGELYGDESIQGDPNKVFRIMNERAFAALKEGRNVVYDATNLVAKKRINFLREVKRICSNEVIPIAVVVLCPIEVCIERDAARERVAGERVIRRMLESYQPPHYYEGWKSIYFHYTSNEVVELAKLSDAANDFDQKNHHHTLTLGEHMRVAANSTPDWTLDIAAMYHDIGKLFTQSFDAHGEAHYYSHDKVGSYYWMCSDLAKDWVMSDMSAMALYVGQLICWHMQPYFAGNKKTFTDWATKRGMSEIMIEDIWTLHEADEEAH